MDILPPNILGQSIFALSEKQREYSYMKYPKMWVFVTHSSHIIVLRGFFAKWGTTSCRDLIGAIFLISDIIGSARRRRGLVVATDSGDSLVPSSLRDVAHHCCPDHVDVGTPSAMMAVAPNECREWGCASSVRRSVQGKVSQHVNGGGSLYEIPEWWIAVRKGRGMPTSKQKSRPGTSRRQTNPSVAQNGGGVDDWRDGAQGCWPGVADRGYRAGKTMKSTQERRNNAQFRKEATAEARTKRGGETAAG